jgi:diguanylate cyclase (GGDEF)-like protein
MRALTLATLLAAALFAHADAVSLGEPIFTTVGDAESIRGLIVSAVAQDRHGFLWLGTHEGVVRYDGYEFRRYRNDPRDERSLSDNVIRSIEPGDDGRIWIATNNGGISIFDPASGKFTRLAGLAGNDARALARGERGMWVGTRAALHFVDYASLRVQRVSAAIGSPRGDSIGSLLMDRNGELWIGSASGLAVRRANGRIEAVAEELRGKPVNRLFQARDGAIWISIFAGGLARLDRSTNELRMLSKQRSYSIAQPRHNEIWIGTSGEGIEIRDASTGALARTLHHDVAVPETIDSDRIGCLFVDRGGVVWIGLWGRGLNRYVPSGPFRILPHSPTRPELLTHADIGCIVEARDGTLWVGTRGNGVDVLDAQRGLLFGVRAGANGLRDGDASAILESDDGAMWIGTDDALHRFDPATRSTKHWVVSPLDQPMGGIATLAAADDGGLWVGATGGLAHFDPKTETSTAALYEDGKPVRGQISAIVRDRGGNVWVATQVGLAVRVAGASRFRKVSSSATLGLLVDRRGVLWVGTATGLDRLTAFDGKRAAFEAVAPRIGREGERGENLLEDAHGRIWIDGETMFDPLTLEARHFARAEGAGRVIWRGAAARIASGQLLFGGPDGLLVADPAAVVKTTYAPPVAISAVRVDDIARSSIARELALDPRSRNLAIEFASLDYVAPERNRYAYRLAGFDERWIETDASRRVAAYTAIPPGRYLLEVRGSNHAGVWSPHVIRLPVVMRPAFHQTLSFRIAMIALALALLYALYRVRIRVLEARRTELEDLVRARTAELDRAARTDFLTALSNRRDLLERAEAVARSGEAYSVVIADVDNFKRLNDELGHDAGDSALRHVAEVLRAQTRRHDVAARWGGEEFLLLLPETNEETAVAVAERARRELQAASWMWDGRSRFVTMTFGVATAAPGEPIDAVIRRADEALLDGKRAGKNRVGRALATA